MGEQKTKIGQRKKTPPGCPCEVLCAASWSRVAHFNQCNHDIKFFSCQNHNSGLRKCSKAHYIRLEFLERVVLYEVDRLASFANEYEDNFIKVMMGRSAKVTENERARKQWELDGLLARDKEMDGIFERLYEDNASQKISDARFAKMS